MGKEEIIPEQYRETETDEQGRTHVVDTRRTYSWQHDENGNGYYEECLGLWAAADGLGIEESADEKTASERIQIRR